MNKNPNVVIYIELCRNIALTKEVKKETIYKAHFNVILLILLHLCFSVSKQ